MTYIYMHVHRFYIKTVGLYLLKLNKIQGNTPMFTVMNKGYDNCIDICFTNINKQ